MAMAFVGSQKEYFEKHFEKVASERPPAFPYVVHSLAGITVHSGLSKREYIAAHAMQGLLANQDRSGTVDAFARDAVAFADALIAELNRESKPST